MYYQPPFATSQEDMDEDETSPPNFDATRKFGGIINVLSIWVMDIFPIEHSNESNSHHCFDFPDIPYLICNVFYLSAKTSLE